MKGTLPKVANRKVVQVSSMMDSVGKYFVLAVCDDGTLWQLENLYRENGKPPYWAHFPLPPQTPIEEITEFTQ